MGIRAIIQKPAFILQLIIGLFIGGGSEFFANSTKGKEIYADVWLQILLPLILLCGVITIILGTWKTVNRQRRFILICASVMLVLFAVSTTLYDWQYLPWGRASAFETADSFMTDLKNADSAAAYERLAPVAQNHIPAKDFNYPETQPASWHWESIDRYSVITGDAAFADGTRSPIEIRLDWINYEWKIYGVKFGELEDLLTNTKPHLYFMFCCDNSNVVESFFSLLDGNEDFGYNFSR